MTQPDLSEVRDLSDGLGALLQSRLATGDDPTYHEALWQDLTSGGWLDFFATGLSESTDVSPEGAVAAAQQLGVYLAPLSTVVACGFLVPLLNALDGTAPLVKDLRTALDRADVVALPMPSVASDPPGYAFTDLVATEQDADVYRLTGTVHRILDLAWASSLLVPVRLPTGALGLARVALPDPHVSSECSDTVVAGVTACIAVLDGVEVSSADVLVVGVADAVRHAGAHWSLALDGYAVGIGDAVLARTISYASEREQFGQPIGTFQAVQHIIADMHIALETSRSLLTAAALHYHESPEDLLDVLASRLHCSESATLMCERAIQVHGGAGFTWELGLHRWYRAAMFAHHYCTDSRGIRLTLANGLRAIARQRGHDGQRTSETEAEGQS